MAESIVKTLLKSTTYAIGGDSRLTILAEFKDSSKSKTMAFCACSCGGFAYRDKSKVLSRHTRSCGCLNNERVQLFIENAHESSPYDAAINNIIHNYRSGARNRGLEYNIPRDYFIELTSSSCSYCGSVPSRESISKGKEIAVYLFNGIDRIDSSKGYVEGNVTTCCYTCNIIKSDRSVEDMYAHINKIIRNLDNAC